MRPHLLALVLLILGVCSSPSFAQAAPCSAARSTSGSPRLVTTDWMMLETLIAIGAEPAGAASLAAFDRWVGTTRPPASVTDLGLRAQPNLALLSQINPDRIVLSRRFTMLKARLSQIAPVTIVPIYLRPGRVWANLVEATRTIATLACQSASGERLIQNVTQTLTQARHHLADQTRPLLMLQFVDQQHVRIYGEGSLYDAVLNQLGLVNAWHGDTNTWGYALVGIASLSRPDLREARIIVVEPLPVGLSSQLAQNGLWQHLPAVRRDAVLMIPEVWSFGGLPSARRLAHLLAQALIHPQRYGFRPSATLAPGH